MSVLLSRTHPFEKVMSIFRPTGYNGGKAEQNIKRPIKEVYVDRGYKGHGCDGSIVTIDRKRQGKLTRRVWKKLKRRAAIEPVIGHLKSDCRLERNYLSGEAGNAINAILSAAGYNFRKLLKGLLVS